MWLKILRARFVHNLYCMVFCQSKKSFIIVTLLLWHYDCRKCNLSRNAGPKNLQPKLVVKDIFYSYKYNKYVMKAFVDFCSTQTNEYRKQINNMHYNCKICGQQSAKVTDHLKHIRYDHVKIGIQKLKEMARQER